MTQHDEGSTASQVSLRDAVPNNLVPALTSFVGRKTFAKPGCMAAFNAYVGGDFQSSTLQMLPFMPDELSWAEGARDISCVVLAGDGTKLTGSVNGTAR